MDPPSPAGHCVCANGLRRPVRCRSRVRPVADGWRRSRQTCWRRSGRRARAPPGVQVTRRSPNERALFESRQVQTTNCFGPPSRAHLRQVKHTRSISQTNRSHQLEQQKQVDYMKRHCQCRSTDNKWQLSGSSISLKPLES